MTTVATAPFSVLRAAATCLLLLAAPAVAQDASRTTLVLADGTPWCTSAVVVDSGIDGPTVLVVGGVHGDEPAGLRAARQVSGWRVARGRMVVVPCANRLASAAGQRRTPDLPKAESDLNRQFPFGDRDEPVGALAAALWRLVREQQPDVVIDLHEGFDFTQRNPKSVGSSVIGRAHRGAAELCDAALAAVNATIEADDLQFVAKQRAVGGSLVRAVADRCEVPALIFETTTKSQPLALRTRQHRLMVHAVLAALGIAAHGPDVLVGDAAGEGDVRVGLFSASGVSGRGPGRVESLLGEGFVVRRFGPADVEAGVLETFDVVVFPGGSGSGQARALGAHGRERVRTFVAGGGGYVGICAGAYLAANNYDWSLRILDADVVDRSHWRRGRGVVELDWLDAAASIGAGPQRNVLYVNGPIYRAAGDDTLPDFEVLATFRGEVHEHGAPAGVMPGTPAIVRARFGEGRVVCSSPHPEQSEGLEDVVRRLVRFAAGG